MSNVVPLHRKRDNWEEVRDLIEWLVANAGDVPIDNLTPGYRLLAESRLELQRSAELLSEVRDLIEDVIERKDRRYNEYAEHWESQHPAEA